MVKYCWQCGGVGGYCQRLLANLRFAFINAAEDPTAHIAVYSLCAVGVQFCRCVLVA